MEVFSFSIAPLLIACASLLSVSLCFLPSSLSLSMLSSPSGSSDSDDSSNRGGERRREDDSERARQQQQQQQQQREPIAPLPSSSGAPAPPRPPSLALSDAEAAAAGAALKRARATARARRKGSLLASTSAPRAHNAVRQQPGGLLGANTSTEPPPPVRLLDPAAAATDADAAARLRAWLSATLARPGAARSAYARHRAAVVRKALALLETKRSEAQDAELRALLGGLSL